MNRHVLPALVLACSCTGLMATPTYNITVVSAIAPNSSGSPSYATWAGNAINALLNNVPTFGNPTLPSYFQEQTDFLAEDLLVTNFNSWLGNANPTGAFANEFGSRLTFGMLIQPTSGQMDIANGVTVTIPDYAQNAALPGDGVGPITFTSYDSIGVFGINLGGPTGFTAVTSGTGLVDEVVLLIGVGLEVDGPAGDQTDLNAAISALQNDSTTSPISFAASVGGSSSTGSGNAFVTDVVPEPTTIALLGSGLLALGLMRRRKRA